MVFIFMLDKDFTVLFGKSNWKHERSFPFSFPSRSLETRVMLILSAAKNLAFYQRFEILHSVQDDRNGFCHSF
jgi:hypothetical protein